MSAATGSRKATPHNKKKKLNWTFFSSSVGERDPSEKTRAVPGPDHSPAVGQHCIAPFLEREVRVDLWELGLVVFESAKFSDAPWPIPRKLCPGRTFSPASEAVFVMRTFTWN